MTWTRRDLPRRSSTRTRARNPTGHSWKYLHKWIVAKVVWLSRLAFCSKFPVLFVRFSTPTEHLNVAYNHTLEMPRRFDVLKIEQRGCGPEAKLVTSTINSLSCENVYDMLGDYAVVTCSNNINFLNWRTSSSTKHAISTLNSELASVRFDFLCTSFAKVLLRAIRLLPENKILTIENYSKIAIYRIPEFRWTKPLEVSPVDENLQQPIWSTWLIPHVQNYASVTLSKPSYGSFATRLAFMQEDRIYGLVIPHDGRTPVLQVLAMAPNLMWADGVTICIDKIYCEPNESVLEASMTAFSWPEEAESLAQLLAWVPPILHFTSKQFAGPSVIRGYDLVDEVSGRVVTGSKYENYDFPEEVVEVEWSDITCWLVVDFFHPQFLPSFKS